MRIIRSTSTWRILFVSGAEPVCLELLALKRGYRICEICDELRCSPRYFHEVCTRDIGLPPKQWMRWERMVVASRMLLGGKSQDEVADALGFANRSGFRREFGVYFSISPTAYQQSRWGASQPLTANKRNGAGLRVPKA